MLCDTEPHKHTWVISADHSSKPHGGVTFLFSLSSFHLSLSLFLPPLLSVSLPFTSAFLPSFRPLSLSHFPPPLPFCLPPAVFSFLPLTSTNTATPHYVGGCFLSPSLSLSLFLLRLFFFLSALKLPHTHQCLAREQRLLFLKKTFFISIFQITHNIVTGLFFAEVSCPCLSRWKRN